MHHIIFDMDGVFADSWGENIECLYQLRFFADTREETILKEREYSMKKPDHARGNGMSEDEYRIRVAKVHNYGLCLVNKNVPVFQQFIEELKMIHNSKMAVVSSNAGVFVKKISLKTGLPFTHVLSFDDSPSKEEKIELVCQDWEIPVSEVIYITDTLADVYELETIMPRKHILGCAWGYCGYAILREELPKEQILRKPEDVHDVISKMITQKSKNK